MPSFEQLEQEATAIFGVFYDSSKSIMEIRKSGDIYAPAEITRRIQARRDLTIEQVQRRAKVLEQMYADQVTEITKRVSRVVNVPVKETPEFYAKMQLLLSMHKGQDLNIVLQKYHEAQATGDNDFIHFCESVLTPSLEPTRENYQFRNTIQKNRDGRLTPELKKELEILTRLQRTHFRLQQFIDFPGYDSLKSMMFTLASYTPADGGKLRDIREAFNR